MVDDAEISSTGEIPSMPQILTSDPKKEHLCENLPIRNCLAYDILWLPVDKN